MSTKVVRTQADFNDFSDAAMWREELNLFLKKFLIDNYVKLSDVKAATTAGGTFTSGAWRTRDLNTLEGSTSFCTLNSNQFTLPKGKYRISATAPGFYVDQHKAKIRNITDSSDEIIGTSENSQNGATDGYDATRSFVVGEFEITGTKVFELQHRCTTTHATNGFGLASNLGVDEVYSVVEIWKIE